MAIRPQQVEDQAAQLEAFDAQVLLDQQTAAAPPETPLTPPAEAPPEAPPAPPEPPVAVDWEQRYKTVKGKYDAEVPQLRNQLADLSDQVKALAAKPAVPETPAAPTATPLTDKDKEDFGPELIDLATRIATHIVTEAIGPLSGTIEGLKSQVDTLKGAVGSVTTAVVEDAHEKFLRELTAQVGDLVAIDTDQRWLDWCGTRMPGTRSLYQKSVTQAFADRDVSAAAELINTWKVSAGLTATVPLVPPAPAVPPLDEMVSPPRSSATPPPGDHNPDEKIWTNAEVQKAFQDIAQKRVTPAEAAALNTELDRAAATGRVRD